MAKFVIGKGLDVYISELEHLGTKNPEICGEAIYEGAKIVADAIRANIQKLPVKTKFYTEEEKGDAVTIIQKQGLLNGFGIAKKEQIGGSFNVKAGFHGYNDTGQPNVMIARSVEGGTYFRNKHPFVRPAVNRVRAQAEDKMKEVVERRTKEIMEG